MVNYTFQGKRTYGRVVEFDVSDGWYLVTNEVNGLGIDNKLWVLEKDIIGPSLSDVAFAMDDMRDM